jgi:hypothetical protein
MKVMVAVVCMACAFSAQAAELTADTNLAIGANTILANFKRLTQVPASEVPNVDRSLAIGARSILGIFTRQTQVATDNVPDVDVAKNSFIQGVMQRQAIDGRASPAVHATSEQPALFN